VWMCGCVIGRDSAHSAAATGVIGSYLHFHLNVTLHVALRLSIQSVPRNLQHS